MFRFGKRNFSLRESPSKLSTLSPRPRLQIGSPSKRLRFGESPQMLSSTLLSEAKPVELEPFQPFHVDDIKDIQEVADKAVRDIQNKIAGEDLKSTLCHERPTAKVPVETPPSTPDVKIISKLEVEMQRKVRVKSKGEELERLVEAKMREVNASQTELESLRVMKLRYNDYLTMISRGQNEIRDHLNQVFSPGEELAAKFEPLMKSLSEKHKNKSEQQTLELNTYLDQTRNAIMKKVEDINHEIEIQQRIQLHKMHFSKDAEVKVDNSSNFVETEDVSAKERTETKEVAEEVAEEVENDDCVILEPAADSHVGHEEIINENSLEISEVKPDNDDTDVEDVDVEETRSFTPCQAQRPE